MKTITKIFFSAKQLILCYLPQKQKNYFGLKRYLPFFIWKTELITFTYINICFQFTAQIHVHWIGDAIWPSYPLPPTSPFALNLSQHQSFPMSKLFASRGQSVGASASASVLLMNIWRSISFRIDWFDLEIQGTLKSLLQHHSSKASIL